MMKKESRIFFIFSAMIILTMTAVFTLLWPAPSDAQGGISGTVFQDFNANGVRDANESGIEGVVVTAYPASATGNTGGVSTTTAADGTYNLPVTGTGPYRVEFTLPTDHSLDEFKPGAAGPTTVQFVSDPNASGVDVGFNVPADYCQIDPPLVVGFLPGTTNYSSGHEVPQGVYQYSLSSLGTTTYESGNPAAPDMPSTLLASGSDVGNVNGLTWHPTSGTIFVSAYARATDGSLSNNGLGPSGLGAIYAIRDGTVSTFAVVNNVGTATGGTADVGKVGLGGLKVSTDLNTLYAVNMYAKTLVDIPIVGIPPTAGTQTQIALPQPSDCAASETHPFGLGVHDNKVYVGMTCGGPTVNDLRGYVYEYDGTTFTQKLNFPLNYPRTDQGDDNNTNNNAEDINHQAIVWEDNPPVSDYEYNSSNDNIPARRERFAPMLVDIVFDGDDMVLGFRSRLSDQIIQAEWTIGGELLRACATTSGSTMNWVLENNGVCNGKVTINPPPVHDPWIDYDNGESTSKGPGGYEFYWGENGFEGEMVQGALAQIPGSDRIYVSQIDALGHRSQHGIAAVSHDTGETLEAGNTFQARLYAGWLSSDRAMKANQLGDIEVLCDPAPLEVGNRLWCDMGDANGVGAGNGVQDPGEEAIANATVTLECDTDGDVGNGYEAIATVTTDSNGTYLFKDNTGDITAANGWPAASWDSNVYIIPRNASCRILVDPTQAAIADSCGAGNYVPTTPDNGGTDSGADLRDSDGQENLDGNGNTGVAFTTGDNGENDHTIDFGFKPEADYDWGDLPDSFATLSASDGPRHAITADLYLGSCVDAEADGQPDAQAGNAGGGSGNGDDGSTGAPVAGTCTNDDDEDGVELTTPLIPGGQACFNVTAHNATANDVNIYAWIDWNGDGDFADGGGVDADESFILGAVPANTDWTDHELCTTVPSGATFDGGEVHMRFRFTTDTLGATDWGGQASDGEVEDYWQPLACAGNYVWDDSTGSTPDVQDGSDTGIEDVAVRMVWAGPDGAIDTDATDGTAQGDDVLYTVQTDINGQYNFCGLIPGTYRAELPNPPAGMQTVTPNSGADDAKDSDGVATGGVGSPVNGEDFTITDVAALPTGEAGNGDNGASGGPNNFPDNQVDETRDFGFRQVNYDWGDLPDSFATLSASDGPRHVITSDLYLGSCVDAEADGQPDGEAGNAGGGSGNGDDGNAGTFVAGACTNDDDEDGIELTTPMVPGGQVCFNVTAHNGTGNDVNIYAWVDWNGDGDFTDGTAVDADESFILGAVPANTDWTDHELCTTVPSGAIFDGGKVHMRFRFTTDTLGATDWGGQASDGEVEDYWQPLACVGNYVWDDSTGSDANVQDGGDSGISGVDVRLVWAGSDGVIDTGADDPTAQNDDTIYTATTDAGGVYSFCGLTPATYRMQIPTPPSNAVLAVTPNQGDDAHDSDGSQSASGQPVEGPDFTVPDPISLPTGENGNEDNPGGINNFPDAQDDLTIDFGFKPEADYDWGDLPDSFATLSASNGPSHAITADLYLGSCVDAEADGQPDAKAGADGSGSGNGDDGNSGTATTGTCAEAGDDEDGVVLTTPMIPGGQACFNVTAHNGTANDVNIYAWVDWNGDGDFADGTAVDADESFILGAVPANTDWTDHVLCTTVPSDATFDGGEVHMRFRLTSDPLGATDWGGVASDGEVEDYWQPLACVGNYVWDDSSGSTPNVQDGSDSGISGVDVRLVWAGPDGSIDTSAGDASAQNDDEIYTVQTDTNGQYAFCGLTPATYRAELPNPPAGMQTVTPNSGADDIDSDGVATGGVGSPVNGDDFTITDVAALPTGEAGNGDNGASDGPNNFPDNQVDETRDFGFTNPKVAIGNLVWNDANGNSQWDSGEAGIDGITVTLYQDSNGNGICEPGTDTQVATVDTSGGGYYQFLDLTPSDSADPSTNYCVVVDKNDVTAAGYAYSSAGGDQNPDATGDHDAANGDDGVPSGNYVISQPFAATLNGQTTADSDDPNGYDDDSAYMTVDFGFLTQDQYDAMATPTSVTMRHMSAQSRSFLWALGFLAMALIGTVAFVWQRRRTI